MIKVIFKNRVNVYELMIHEPAYCVYEHKTGKMNLMCLLINPLHFKLLTLESTSVNKIFYIQSHNFDSIWSDANTIHPHHIIK